MTNTLMTLALVGASFGIGATVGAVVWCWMKLPRQHHQNLKQAIKKTVGDQVR